MVEPVHLELPLEVRDHAQPLDHRARAVLAREVDHQLAEDVDDDVVELGEGVLEERDPLLDRERRLLVLRVAHDADHHAVEVRGRTPDHVDVPEGHGVEGARVDGDDRVTVVVMARRG